MGSSDFLWGLLAGGAPSVLLAIAIVWWLRRQRAARRRSIEPTPEPARSALLPEPATGLEQPTPETPAVSPPSELPEVAPTPPEPVIESAPVAEVPVPAEAPAERASPRAEPPVVRSSAARKRKGPVPPSLRIPYRILLHVARQGRFGPDEVPAQALSQAGMVEALGVRQGAVAAALQRLIAAELLEVERSHVQGGERRLKVYRLTPRGEELVRDLRRRGRARS